MATTKELMALINFLDNRGLLSIPIEKHDYEKTIWEFEKTIKPKEVEKSNNNKNYGTTSKTFKI